MLKEAFERAGLSPAHIAFAAACHDIAKLALNKQPDPARAAHTWLGMASGQMFREGPLREFLVAVAKERAANMSSAEVRGQLVADPHGKHAPTPADTNSDARRGQVLGEPHIAAASPASELYSGNETDHASGDAQDVHVSPLPEINPVGATGHHAHDAHGSAAPVPAGANSDDGKDQTRVAAHQTRVLLSPEGPTQHQINAVTRAKERSAQIMSGVYIPDHRGGSELFDDIKIRYYNMTRERLARAVGRNSVAYNLIRIAETRLPANHEQMNSATTSGDIFTSSEIRMMQQQAAVFAGSGLISLPEELRSVVAQAVEAA
jgi:hypothetical protein